MVTLLGQQNIPHLAWHATNWTQISILEQMGASNCYHKVSRRHYITAILQVTLWAHARKIFSLQTINHSADELQEKHKVN